MEGSCDISGEERALLIDGLERIDAILRSAPTDSDALDGIIYESIDALGLEGAVVGLYDGEVFLVERSIRMPSIAAGDRLTADEYHILRLTLEAGGVVAVGDALADTRLNRLTLERLGIRAMAMSPVLVGGRMLGGIVYYGFRAPVQFSDAAVTYMRRMAVRIGLVLRHELLVRELEDEIVRARVLQDAARALAEASDSRQMASRVLASASSRLGMQSGAVMALDDSGGRLRLLAHSGLPDATAERIREIALDDPEYLVARAATTGAMLTHSDEQMNLGRLIKVKESGIGESRYAAVPLFDGDRVIGTCTLVFEGRRDFAPEEIAFFDSLCSIVGNGLKMLPAPEA
jgi:GAF domain-containing protein